MFNIGLYGEKYEKIFLFETIRPRALIFGMQHHLVYLYQVVQIMPLGPIMAQPQGSHVLHRLLETMKKSSY